MECFSGGGVGYMYQGMHLEIRGQHMGVGFLFVFTKWSLGNGFGWSGLLAAFTSADLSCWPSCNVFTVHTSVPTVLGL